MRNTKDWKNMHWQVTNDVIQRTIDQIDKFPLSAGKFERDMEDAKDRFLHEIGVMDVPDKNKLLISYLSANDFTITDISDDMPDAQIAISKALGPGMISNGIALVSEELGSLPKSLLDADLSFIYVYLPSSESGTKLQNQPKNVVLITNNEIVTFLQVLLLDKYFDEYFMSITSMPGLKEKMWSYLRLLDITFAMFSEITARWRKLTNQLV